MHMYVKVTSADQKINFALKVTSTHACQLGYKCVEEDRFIDKLEALKIVGELKVKKPRATYV